MWCGEIQLSFQTIAAPWPGYQSQGLIFKHFADFNVSMFAYKFTIVIKAKEVYSWMLMVTEWIGLVDGNKSRRATNK